MQERENTGLEGLQKGVGEGGAVKGESKKRDID